MPRNELSSEAADQCELVEAAAMSDLIAGLRSQPGNRLRARTGSTGRLQLQLVAALDFGPFNRVIGLGVGKPATERQIDDIVDFYHDAGLAHFVVSLSPHARPGLIPDWLRARRMVRSAVGSKVWRDLTDPDREPFEDLRIETIGPAQGTDWASVQRASWGMPAATTPWFTSSLGRDRWRHYLAFEGVTPVAAAALFVLGEIGWLGFGATVPTHRDRGYHRAMIGQRIRDARALGCRLLVAETDEDTAHTPNRSFHNLSRGGFRLAYVRTDYTPGPGAERSS